MCNRWTARNSRNENIEEIEDNDEVDEDEDNTEGGGDSDEVSEEDNVEDVEESRANDEVDSREHNIEEVANLNREGEQKDNIEEAPRADTKELQCECASICSPLILNISPASDRLDDEEELKLFE